MCTYFCAIAVNTYLLLVGRSPKTQSRQCSQAFHRHQGDEMVRDQGYQQLFESQIHILMNINIHSITGLLNKRGIERSPGSGVGFFGFHFPLLTHPGAKTTLVPTGKSESWLSMTLATALPIMVNGGLKGDSPWKNAL